MDKKRLHHRLRDACGYSLPEVLVVSALIAIASAIAVPTVRSGVDRLRLGMSARDVQSDLQTARLRAVSGNTYMRVRFNCPTVGQFRVVERIGPPLAADSGDDMDSAAARRCDAATYPYKPIGSDTDRVSKPNNDGPVRMLQEGVTFTAQQPLEFWPDGTVHGSNAGMWPQIGAAGVTITLQKDAETKTITVTPLGNIQMQR